MVSRSIASGVLVISLLVPLALVFNSKGAGGLKQDAFDNAIDDDVDASISLLQKTSEVHHSRGTARAGISKAALAGTGVNVAAAFAEYVAMALFVIIGCGSAMGIANKEGSAWVLQVALTFGIAISVLAYSIGHISGGQINCAVTFALVLNGSLGWLQGLVNLVFQLLGSVTGALVLSVIYPREKDLTGSFGSNGVGDGWSRPGALVGEVIGTFLLCFTVLNTAIDPATIASRQMACLAIGLSVFLAHSVLIPIDGCSINPTRSFGPALIASQFTGGKELAKSTWADMWIFWVGPLTGAAAAVGVYQALN